MPTELIEAMASPGFYPHHPERVEMRQTHISWVFLAGSRVYKVKKPVALAFLDYSTLEARLHWCEEEVRLNRRLAPTVYHGVVPIERFGEGYRLGRGGEPVEYAVEMRRLPDEAMLDRRIASGRVDATAMQAIAGRLAYFHRHQGSGARRAGAPGAVRETVETNLREAAGFVERTISRSRFDRLLEFFASFVDDRRALFEARVREGRIRDGHGDLRAEHVCLEEDGLSIFDCVEFSERLRTTDVASEIAFLKMDLDFLDRPDLAEELVRAYAASARDETLASLVPFYAAYRACVRGKVESLRSDEPEVPVAERRVAEIAARRFFVLASRYASSPVPTALVVLCGQVATGKSSLARLAADRTGFALHSSDRTRKALFGLAPTDRPTGAEAERLYADDATEQTYAELFARADADLAAGRGAVLDATFGDRTWRDEARRRARKRGCPFLFVESTASEAVVLERLERRAARGDDPSDATVRVYRERRGRFSPPDELPADRFLRVDTAAGLLAAFDDLESRLAAAGA